MSRLATNRGFLTVYMVVIAILTVAACIPMHFINTGSTLTQLLLIPFWYILLGASFSLSYSNCIKKGKPKLTTFYLAYKGVKMLLSLVFILVSALIIEKDLIPFMVIFLVFFLVLTVVETMHFIEIERNMKKS